MSATGRRVASCAELTTGDRIEARRDGVIHFTGRVTDMLPAHGLFWAVSDTGERRIVELGEFLVQTFPDPT